MNFGRRGKRSMSPDDFLSRQASHPENAGSSSLGDYVSADQKLQDLREKREGYSGPVPESLWKQESEIYKSQDEWKRRMDEGGSTIQAEDLRKG